MKKWMLCLFLAACAGSALGTTPSPGYRRAYVEDAIGARFVYVPPGSFTMGSRYAELTAPESEKRFFADEAPPHEVTISSGFWLASTEVTVAQFRKFVEETGYRTSAEKRGESLGEYLVTADDTGKKSGVWGFGKQLDWRRPGWWPVADHHPVTHVSWEDAAAFCQWLSDKTGRNYRLPTEAEWEYAAGGPGHTTYSWGNGGAPPLQGGNIADARFARAFPEWKYPVLHDYDDTHVVTAPVASYAANEFGLFDMTGNVWEWVGDFYSPTYYAESPAADPRGPAAASADPANPEARPRRVHRGGGFDWELPYLRVAKRRAAPEDSSAVNIGFRIASSER